MKVSIGAKVVDGPWGGGNLFVKNLSNYLLKYGHSVIYDLNDKEIDIILLTDPRKNSESSSFTHKEIRKYKKKINPNVKVVHRINECDERKNTKGLNKYYIKANLVADYTIFVSSWLKDIYINSGYVSHNDSVILAGADNSIFNRSNLIDYLPDKELKIVTHHWSNNWNKGFNVYEQLDNLLSESNFKENFKFTYIGNLPKNFKFRNSVTIKPLQGDELAKELKSHHVYLTASINEPSGNHHIEAAQCGLPLLYINSGGIPEYCKGYGVMFDEDNFINKLFEIRDNYNLLRENMNSYKNNSDKMCQEFVKIFNGLLI